MSAFDPLLRSAVGFVRRGPAWSFAVALAVGSFAAARATAPLVTEAAADRSFAAEAAVAATSARLGQGLDARAYTTGLTDLAVADDVSRALDDLPVYDPGLVSVSPLLPYTDSRDPTPVIRSVRDGRQSTAVLFALGDANTSLRSAPGSAPGDSRAEGVWIPDTVAAELGVIAGDQVELALEYAVPLQNVDPDAAAATVVAGVYLTSGELPASDSFDWTSLPGPLPRDPVAPSRTARLLLTDAGSAMTLIAAMGDTPFVTWDLTWRGPVSLEQGRAAAEATRALGLELQNSRSLIGRAVASVEAEPVVLSSGVGAFVLRSDQAAAELEPVVSSIALTAQVMSVMVLAFCVWTLTRRRQREHSLSLSMGMHPIRLGFIGVVEQLAAIVAGIAAAYIVVRWSPGVVAGDGAISRATIDRAAGRVLWTIPLAATVVVVAVSAAVWPLEPSSAGRVRRIAGAVHAETVVVVGAVATVAQLVTQKGSALDSGTSLLFPLLAVLSGAALAVRALRLVIGGISSRHARGRRAAARSAIGVGALHVRPPRSLALWLARRRVFHSLTELSALVIIVAAGVALFIYCSSVAGNGERGVADKAAALGGAASTVAISSADQLTIGADGFPAELPDGWTVVWTVTTVHMTSNLVSDLLVVDPETFPDAVDWRDSFADDSLESLMQDVADSEPFDVSIIVAGNYADEFPDTGTMGLEDGLFIRYRVVGRIAAAPWLRERASMAIVAQDVIAPLIPDDDGSVPGPSNTVGLDRMFRTYVWSDSSQAELSAALGLRARDVESTNVTTEERQPAFVAFRLSLPYLRLVGIALLVVSLASIVVLGARRRVDLALELAMTDKMGMPRRTTTIAVVGGSVLLGVLGSAIGVALARPLVAFMTHRLDPGPAFAPTFSGTLSWTAVGVAILAVGGVSFVSALMEVRGARRARVAEVLRDAE